MRSLLTPLEMAASCMRQWRRLAAVTGAALLLTACAVGPDFQRPDAPDVTTYTRQHVTDTSHAKGHGGHAQKFEAGHAIAAQWWRVFHSQDLNHLITQAVANSPTMQSAKASLDQAKANLDVVEGGLFPQFDLQLGAQRGQTGGPTSAHLLGNLFSASLNASYTLDIFGSVRRGVEVRRAQVDMQRNQLRATYLTLVGNVVSTAINVASLQRQLQATQTIIKAEKRQLSLAKLREKAGAVSQSDVLQAKTQLAATRTRLAPLRQQLSVAQNRLAVLSGVFPSQWNAVHFKLKDLTLPETLPLVVPSGLVKKRPDILAATSALHAASAQVGVATANLYPHLSLTGSYGSQAAKTSHLFNVGNTIWNIGVSLLQPLFHGDALHAQKRAAVAGYKQALAHYRQTVLQAFSQVGNTLQALESDAVSLKAQQTALQSARRSLDLTQAQYKAGGASFITVLSAIQQYQTAQLGYVQALAQRYQDTALLFNTLGGGWWKQSALQSDSHSNHSMEQ